MREKCLRCFRPRASCLCADIVPVETGVTFLFLTHPKEAYHQRTGSGRLACLSLPPAKIITGVDFSSSRALSGYLSNPEFYPVLLYPGEQARTGRALAEDAPALANGQKRLLVLVLDATWFFAKKMLRLSPNLHTLPRVTLSGAYRSQFRFKRQPAPECLSTIEACYYLIRELQQASLVPRTCDPAPLMTVFTKMVDFQLACEHERKKNGLPGNHAYDNKPPLNRSDLHRKHSPRTKRSGKPQCWRGGRGSGEGGEQRL